MTKAEFNFYFYNDPLGCLLVNHTSLKPGTTLQPGKWFYYYQKVTKSGGWNPITGLGGAFVSLATGTFGALGSFVNYLNQISQEIEAAVVSVILEVVQVVDVLDACGTLQSAGLSCKSLVKAGIKSGLLAMGVPPVSVPNWEQLQDQGFDYMSGVIANEVANATGIPAELTEDKIKELAKTAAKKALEEITKKRQIAPTYAYDWVIPYEGVDPAVWFLSIKKNPGDALPRNLHFVRKPAAPPLFTGGDSKIPHIFPESTLLKVPLVLPFDFSLIDAPFCRTDRSLNTNCVPFPFSKVPLCQREELQPSQPGQPQAYKWVAAACSAGAAATAVSRYYRDKWFDTYNGQNGTCFEVLGRLFSDVNGLDIPYPFAAQLLSFVRLRSDQWWTWDSFIFFSSLCS